VFVIDSLSLVNILIIESWEIYIEISNAKDFKKMFDICIKFLVIMESSYVSTNIDEIMLNRVFARNEKIWQKKASLYPGRWDINR